VRLYACWWGGENEPVHARRPSTLEALADRTEPFEEHVLVDIVVVGEPRQPHG
jgi:hypothetical protein